MNEANHTPAPWHVGASGITVFARDGVNKVAAPGTDVPIGEKAANARLIAAAPLLLEACRAALNNLVGIDEPVPGGGSLDSLLAVAIYQATGEPVG